MCARAVGGTPLEQRAARAREAARKNGGVLEERGRHVGRLLACLACDWKNGTQRGRRAAEAAVLGPQHA